MKRLNEIKATVAVAIVAILAAACSLEYNPAEERTAEEFVTFTASFDNPLTKTYLDGTRVKWELNDKLSLWYGTLNTAMTEADYFVGAVGTDARTATLNGFAKESDDYMAVYPRSAAKDCSKKGKLTVEMPMEQELRIGSFGSDANVSVAYSNATDLAFKNVGGLLAFKIATTGGHTVKKIRLTGTAAMAGEVEIKQATIAAGNPTVDAINESINFLTLDCGEGIEDPGKDMGTTEFYSKEPGTWGDTKAGAYSGSNVYYLAALPDSHTSFALTFVDSEGKTAVAKSSYSYTIDRNSNTLIANVSLSDDNFKKDKEIYINEIFCHEDKIELYNAEKKAVDLTGYYFTKDDEKYWAIPAGTTIPAKGYLVINAGQSDCTLGPTWGISGDKGFELKLSNGKKVDKIDNTGDGKLIVGETETMGRRTNGADEWVVFSTGTIYEDGTCDGDNSKGTVKEDVVNTVVINEIDCKNKKIELFNSSDDEIDISDWTLFKQKATTDTPDSWAFSNLGTTKIVAGGYLVINAKQKDPKDGPTFGISGSDGFTIKLTDGSGNEMDYINNASDNPGKVVIPDGSTYGKIVDGFEKWMLFNDGGSIGAANNGYSGIVLNEINGNDYNAENGNDKFVEIYNSSSVNTINLYGCKLYKNNEAFWTGKDKHILAPGEYLVLYSNKAVGAKSCDPDNVINTGISSKKGLKIDIFSASGVCLDSFMRGSSIDADISPCSYSYGRTPDGTGVWKLIDSTPGTANGASRGDIPQS